MNRNTAPVLATVGALVYVLGLAFSMTTVSYDIWGAFIIVPPFAWLTVVLVRRLFYGGLAELAVPLLVGYALKLLGSVGRYWISFDAYGGSTDAQRYHLYARQAAGAFWSGTASLSTVLPGGTGTQFVERTTSFLYAIFGSSKLGAYMVFSTLAWWGTVLFVKAACNALPGLARRKYTWMCALAPSVLYWPSSIGKEALMALFLGIATFGIARLIAGYGVVSPVLFGAVGLALAASIRGHVAGIWIAGVIPAVIVAFGRLLSAGQETRGRGAQLVVFGLIGAVAIGAFFSVSTAALEVIKATDEQESFTTSITEVLRETTRRSDQGGSNFGAPEINGVQDWPYAVVRTLTRPLFFEAKGTFQWLAAGEMTLLVLIALYSWRRVSTLLYWTRKSPYVTFAVTVLFAGGLAYSSFANLGILTRQKSLLFPFLLLLPCLPLRPPRWTAPVQPRSMLDEYGIRDRVAMGRLQ